MDFSFIIPVFNCRATLTACVQSILQAHIPSSEILLIDDGSTDGSGQLCSTLARQYAQIKVIHQSNLGASAARNTGLQACMGSHILFADADDTLDSALLKKILTNTLCTQSDLTVFGMEFQYFYRGKCTKREMHIYEPCGVLSVSAWGQRITELFQCNALSSLCNKVFKREIIERNHLRMNSELFLYEDLDFVLRYLCFCSDIWNIPNPVYQYHLSESNLRVKCRLSRISSIQNAIAPIQLSIIQLMQHNNAVTKEACQEILQKLYWMLIREKRNSSSVEEIRNICRDYALWEKEHIENPLQSTFRDQLIFERIVSIWIYQKASALRHQLGIWYRWLKCCIRKDPYGH